jgi:phosphoglycerate dehydrogenase-like enzyme
MNLPRVLYWSHAPESVYEVIRSCAHGIAQVDTLERDDPALRAQALLLADVLIVAARPVSAEELAQATRLRLLHHQGVGYQDTVPVAELARRGIRLALTPEGTTTGVAEHTIMLMLAVYKRLAHVDAQLRQGHWHINTYRSESRELAGKRVGYIGFGRIGQAVAARLHAFGTEAVFHDPGIDAPTVQAGDAVALAMPLDALLASVDIVTLHLPYTPGARHILNAAAMARMRPGAIVINAARGGLIEETALCQALDSGHLGGAGLDCFEREPAVAGNPLFAHRHVVVTPHTAAATIDALQSKMRALFDNVARWSRDEPLNNEVLLAPASHAPLP